MIKIVIQGIDEEIDIYDHEHVPQRGEVVLLNEHKFRVVGVETAVKFNEKTGVISSINIIVEKIT